MTWRLAVRRRLVGDGRTLMAGLAADPGDWLPRPARRRGIDRWTINLIAGPLTRSVACHVGSVWWVGDTVWRSITWQPQPEPDDIVGVDRLLPVLCGELGLRRDGDDLLLTLRGSYAPPAGRLGVVADAAALRRVAISTGQRFLADVADRLPQARSPAASRSARRPVDELEQQGMA